MNSNEWAQYKLGDICIKIGSGATPRGGKEVYLEEGPVALIRSQNVLDYSFSYGGLAYIDEDQANQLSNVEVENSDVLLNITGDSVARVCQVPNELLPARVNQHVAIIRPDRAKADAQFLKYYLLNPKFKNQMLAYASVGATRKALTKGMIEDFDIVLPAMTTQRRIAAILSALDDKIELNRQTNATLEAIAQTLFKEWFVDFNFPLPSTGSGSGIGSVDGSTPPELVEAPPELVEGGTRAFDYRRYFALEPKDKLNFILAAANHIAALTQEQNGQITRNGKERFKQNVLLLQKAFALSVPHPKTAEIRDDLALFQAIKARFAKFDEQQKKRSNEEIETAIRQIINDAIISEEVIDVFDAAGIKKPDISILSDEFMAEVRGMPYQNLAFELLKRLLNDEIKNRAATNLVQSRKFSEMLADAVRRYQNGLIDSARVIEELIKMAQEMREADKRGEKMNLRVDELAFYDALADNPTAEAVLGDDILKQMAHELVESVRRNTSIDWQLKESVQAKLRVLVKRILRKYKYPPDDPNTGEYTESVNKVLDQAERLADFWTADD